MLLGFKKQFAEKVENYLKGFFHLPPDQLKGQSIRAFRKKRPFRWGDSLQIYTGLRTKYCRKLGDAVLTELSTIIIFEWGCYLIDDQAKTLCTLIHEKTLKDLAVKDGFESWGELIDFFRKEHGLPFCGQLLRW